APARDPFDEMAEEQVPRVAVVPLLPRLKIERLVAEPRDDLRRRRGKGLQLPVFRKAGEVRNARRVRQQVGDADLVPSGGRIREVALHQVVQLQLAALFEEEDGGGGELLGQ